MTIMTSFTSQTTGPDAMDTLNDMLAWRAATERKLAPVYDIYLLAGQSNMQGRVAPDGSETDQVGVFQFPSYTESSAYRTISSDITPLIHLLNEYYVGPGDYFGKAKNNATERQVLLVPCAAAGSQLVAGNAQWKVGGPFYNAAIAQANAAIAAAQAVSTNSVLKGILWAQGESDGSDQNGNTYYATYRAALAAMIAGLRSNITGAVRVPFVIGGMVPEFIASADVNKGIARAHAQATALNNVFYFTGPTGQTGDNLHYLRPALSTLAASYIAAPTAAINFLRFVTLSNMAETAYTRGYGYQPNTAVSYSTPTATAKTNARLTTGQDGFFAATLPEAPGASGPIIGMSATTPTTFLDCELAIYADTSLVSNGYTGTQYGVLDHGTSVARANLINAVTMLPGDVLRFRRAGNTGFLEVSQDGMNTWTVVYSATVSTGVLSPFIQCGSNAANGIIQQPFGSANVL
jgi:hypothetical protein